LLAPASSSKPPRYSVAIMCFNERESLEEVIARTLDVMNRSGDPFEVLIVNDGSTDGSGELADTLARAHAEVRVCHHPTNLGIGATLMDGYQRTTGEFAVILPADLQFSPDDLPRAFEKALNADVVVVHRDGRRDSWIRKMISLVDQTLVCLLFGLWMSDLHWVRVYRRSILDAVSIQCRTPMVDTELLVKAKWLGARIEEMSLPHYARYAGTSTGANLKRLVRTFADLIKLRWGVSAARPTR